MAQIYDRIQIKNSHLFSQLTDITALARFCKKLNGTVVTVYRYTALVVYQAK